MKNVFKNLIVLSSVLVISACSGGAKSTSGGSSSGSKLLKGRAAKGAYLPQGAVMQVRTGSGTVSSTTVSDSTGDFTFDIAGTNPPYLVRGCDGDCTNGGKWYYSYSGSAPLQNTIGVLADVAGSLNNKYFTISAISTATQNEDDFYVWFNVGGNGVDPAIAGKTGIEVSVAQNATASTNATAIAQALVGYTNDFAAAYVDASGTNVIVLNNVAETLPQAADGAATTGFSFASEAANVANVNPYTDILIRAWYNQVCVVGGADGLFNIDDLFISGVYPSGTHICVNTNYQGDPGFLAGQAAGAVLPDNTPIDLPNEAAVQEVGALLSNVISDMYGVNLQNTLMVNWVQGEGFDALLDSVGIDQLQYYLFASEVMQSAWLNPTWMTKATAYEEVVVAQTGSTVTGSTVHFHADFWTTQSNQVAVQLVNCAEGFTENPTTVQQSDSLPGLFHYESDYVGPATRLNLNQQTPNFCDQAYMTANGDAVVEIVLPLVNYATGTLFQTTYPGYPGTIGVPGYPWTPGQGASVSQISGNNVTFTIPDLTPSTVTVTDSNGNVLGTQSYNSVNPWVGTSGTVTLSSMPSSFTLSIVGANAQRTSVNYQQ